MLDRAAPPRGATLKPHSELPDPERLFRSLRTAKKLLLAVSGGPDSMALMLIAARWSGRDATLIEVATVDHGLRDGSDTEAEQVARWAHALGFPHHVLPWHGEKPKTRIQERAREARYRLLEECVRRIGAGHVVTAHHADDQAETVLLRLTRGSGPAGLAGMAALTRLGEVTLARPLLGVAKADLVRLCEDSGQPFFRDASNENVAFARTRLRKIQKLLDAEGLDRASLLRLARRAARAEAALAETAASLRQRLCVERSSSHVKIAGEALAQLPEEIFLRVLEAELRAFSEAHDRLRLDRLERAAAEILAALRKKRVFAATLGGARMAVTLHGDLEISRAPPRRGPLRSA
ncbi:MAG: tRNA(Ile)-lysidine synthase [Methylobacteriaceae bacterium]|jgi:tRNA(Ile)-lysidine synthase|nr:tRNA(Ile)-lysidine synthase [Methylobacteriaceae bacterium]